MDSFNQKEYQTVILGALLHVLGSRLVRDVEELISVLIYSTGDHYG